MKSKKHIVVFILFITFLIFVNCTDKPEKIITAPFFTNQTHQDQSVKAAEEKLDMLAQSIAYALREPSVSDLINFKIKSAETREHILDFAELVTTTKTVEGFTIIQKMTAAVGFTKNFSGSKNELTESFIYDIITEFEPMIDIYFPVPEHRKRWLAHPEQLLVAYNPLTIDDTQWEIITAYTLDDQVRLLDAKTPPQEPVLVISRCEHGGNHSVQLLRWLARPIVEVVAAAEAGETLLHQPGESGLLTSA